MSDKYQLLEELAVKIATNGIKENELLLQWDYRKGKTFADVRNAVIKGRKRGLGKFETEIMEIAFCLDDVIKKKRKVE